MIHIEKLSLKNVGSNSWQTFNSLLYAPDVYYTKSFLSKTPWVNNNKIISKNITPFVLQTDLNVSIGKYFGKSGIALNQLLSNDLGINNLVIEMQVGDLTAISTKQLKLLLETYVVMLNDFAECSTTYGARFQHIVSFLSEKNIKPKMLFLVGCSFQSHKEYKPLNIFVIPFEYWLLTTAISTNYFSDAIFDSEYKEKLVSILYNEPTSFCSMPMFKPRKHRIELLAHLDKSSILKNIDWSLGIEANQFMNKFIDVKSVNPLSELSLNATTFLSKYKFPKELDFTDTWKLSGSPFDGTPTLPSQEWMNKFKFIVCSETYIGNEIEPIMGGCAFVSEKTFKSFLYGAVPIIHGGKGSTDHVVSLGFKTQINGYDESSMEDIERVLRYVIDNPFTDKSAILHNFNRITDLEFLCSLIQQPLLKIADLINSIRR